MGSASRGSGFEHCLGMAGKKIKPVETGPQPGGSSKGSVTTTASDGGTPMETVLDNSVARMKAGMRVVP